VEPAFTVLADAPHFASIEATMLAAVNADRELPGLALSDEDYNVLQ